MYFVNDIMLGKLKDVRIKETLFCKKSKQPIKEEEFSTFHGRKKHSR